MKVISLLISLSVLLFSANLMALQTDELIDKILEVRRIQNDAINDMVISSEQFEKKIDDDGNVKETKKFIKTIFVKKNQGSWLVKEQYNEYYLNGIRQDDDELRGEIENIEKDKKKRGNRDLTYDMLAPLLPENREMYKFDFAGNLIADIDGYDCYVLKAEAIADIDTLLNYTYFIDSASCHLVKADFVPAQLTDNFFFKLKEFNMAMSYDPYDDAIWVPYQFVIQGKGKAMMFIDVNFKAEELYSDTRINVGLPDSLFDDNNK